MTKSSNEILKLIELSLDEFDTVSVAVSARRGVRIANLLGETQTALRFLYEVKFTGGSKASNAEDTRRLMVDPSQWADESGPAVLALNEWMADRARNDNTGRLSAHTLDEIDYLLEIDDLPMELVAQLRGFRATARSRIFTCLCAWERRLGSSAVRETALAHHEARVDALLEETCPDVLGQFNAAFRRLNEAADAGLSVAGSEELAQAVVTCRRILKAVVDKVRPVDPAKPESESGNPLTDPAYKNRLFEFLKSETDSATHTAALTSAGESLWERFAATDTLSSKGVHAQVARDEAELCALNTYLVAGEVLRIWQRQSA